MTLKVLPIILPLLFSITVMTQIPSMIININITTRILQSTPPCGTNEYINNNYCQPCNQQCSTCADDTGDCQSCNTGYTNVPQCLMCQQNCTECDGYIDNCTSCISNYNLIYNSSDYGRCELANAACLFGQFKSNGICTPCDQSCNECQDLSSNCTSCKQGQTIQYDQSGSGNCIQVTAACELGQFLSSGGCDGCDQSCSECYAYSHNCTVCGQNQYLQIDQAGYGNCQILNTPTPGCMPGQFESSGICNPCDQNCTECIAYSQNCTACGQNYLLQFNQSGYGNCILSITNCPSGQFLANGGCNACDQNCTACYDYSNNCTACGQEYFLQSNQSGYGICFMYYTSCPPGQLLVSGICSSCDQSCTECSAYSYNCTACGQNQTLQYDQSGYGNCSVSSTPPAACQPGQFQSNGVCNPCDQNCSECDAYSYNCTACGQNYVLQLDQSGSGTCLLYSVNCPPGQFLANGGCNGCDQSCSECYAYSYNCTACTQNQSLQFDQSGYGNCSIPSTPAAACQPGQFQSNGVCNPCDQSCSECYAYSYNCTACAQNQVLQYDQSGYGNCSISGTPILACIPGQFESSGICNPCDQSCSECSTYSYNCTACGQNQTLQYDQPGYGNCSVSSTPPAACQPGQFQSNGVCNPCNSLCSTCDNSTGDCTSCTSGYYLDNGICLACDSNCQECETAANNCVACINSYFLFQPTNICVACNTNNCDTCDNSSGNCITCLSNYYLSVTTCQSCNTNCQTCSNITGDCQTCSGNTYLSGSSCLNCDSTCTSCSNTTGNCLTCNPGQYLSGMTCTPCIIACATCSSTNGDCITCNNGYYPSGNTCNHCSASCPNCSNTTGACLQCPQSTYISGTNCISCPSNCIYCPSSACKTCASGFYNSNGTCKNCPFNCTGCTNQGCTGCISGMFIHQQICIPCNTNCSGCNYLTGNCLACQNGLSLRNGICTDSSCDSLHYLYAQRNLCLPCSSTCADCDQTNGKCTACFAGYFLQSEVGCAACSNTCKQCEITSINCTVCSSLFIFNQSTSTCIRVAYAQAASGAISMPAMSKIPLLKWAAILTDYLWLYNYANRTYDGPVDTLFETISGIERLKWSFLSLHQKIGINPDILGISDYTPYSNKRHLQVDRQGDFFLENCFHFLLYTIPQTFISFFVVRQLFFLLFQYRASVYIRAFAFWGFLWILCIQSNIEYMSYLAFNHCRILFSLAPLDKFYHCISIVLFFALVIYTFAAYYLLSWSYSSKTKYFIDKIKCQLSGFTFVMMFLCLRSFLVGCTHSLLHSYYTLQMLTLCSIELTVSLLCSYMLFSHGHVFQTKLQYGLTIVHHTTMTLFDFSLLTDWLIINSAKNDEFSLDLHQEINTTIETIIKFVLFNTILRMFAPLTSFIKSAGGTQAEREMEYRKKQNGEDQQTPQIILPDILMEDNINLKQQQRQVYPFEQVSQFSNISKLGKMAKETHSAELMKKPLKMVSTRTIQEEDQHPYPKRVQQYVFTDQFDKNFSASCRQKNSIKRQTKKCPPTTKSIGNQQSSLQNNKTRIQYQFKKGLLCQNPRTNNNQKANTNISDKPIRRVQITETKKSQIPKDLSKN